MNISKKVSWEKWRDPFTDDDNHFIAPESFDVDNDNEDEDEVVKEINELLDESAIEIMQTPMKVVITQMGLVPLMEHSFPSKIFKFWTGHTNFDITPSIASKIENIPGVETLSIFTRYRFRIGIGKMFKDRDVMYKVQEAVSE